MAAAKRKQDEKHLKMLRDMAALPHNKQCFDCHQRGPTYVNMTIGSFVCTSCSGILRGINPPHRVKSISMASFTPDEIDFIKCHGNEFCRKVWLGLYDSRTGMPEPDSREEQKVRDFMIQKYERKRWYVAPTDTMKEEARRINEAATNKQPTTRPLKSLLGENASKLVVKDDQSPQQTPKNQPSVQSTPGSQQTTQSTPEQKAFPSPGQHSQSSQSSASTTMDLLGDLGGDPFASSAPGPPPAVGVGVGAGSGGDFADFSNFNQFSAQASSQQPFQAFPTSSNPLFPLGNTPSSQPQVANGSFAGMNSTTAPPVSSAPAQLGGDKYSALSDLFSGSPATTQAESTSFSWNGGSSGTGVNWAGGSNTSSNSTGIAWNSTGNSSSGGINWNSSGSTNTSSNAGINWNNPPSTQSAANSGFSTSGTSLFGGSNAISSQSTPGGVSGSNPFGATSSNASLFGNQPSTTGGFGQQPTQGGFGQPVAASGGFGQPVAASGFGQPVSQSGGFGQPASQLGGFGQPASQIGGFGQPAPQSGGFGQPASQPAGFGQPASQPAGFGQPTSQPAGFGQPASQPAGFGQPVSSNAGGFNAAFGGSTGGLGAPSGGVGSSPAGSQFGQMQNGNSGFNTMGPVSSAGGFGGFSQTQTMPNFGNQMTAPTGQFGNKMGASGGAQMQGFPGGWGSTPAQAPTANPFMSAASQPVAPKSGSTNPFL